MEFRNKAGAGANRPFSELIIDEIDDNGMINGDALGDDGDDLMAFRFQRRKRRAASNSDSSVGE